jgi:hypothetical protein
MKKSIIFIVDAFPKNTNQIIFLNSFSKLKKSFKLILFVFEKKSQNTNTLNKVFDIKFIKTKKFFYTLIQEINPKIIFNLREKNFSFLEKAKNKNYTLATYQQGNLPFEMNALDFFFFLKNIFFFLNIHKIKTKLNSFFDINTGGERIKYDIFFCGSQIIYNQANIKNKSYRLIKGHSYDYEEFLNLKNSKKFLQVKSKKYFVFIDNGMFFNHPDLKKFNMKIKTPLNYRNEINNFLSYISNFLKLKIIILGHPKNRDQKKLLVDFYNCKNIFFDRSCDLIKSSSLVVTHSSTAISFAVLFNKPIIFLTSNEIIKLNWPHKFIITQAHETGSIVMNLSKFFMENISLDMIMNIDYKKYKSYLYKYIYVKKSSEPISKIIKKEFLKINYK